MSSLAITTPDQRTGYRVRLAVFEGPLDLLLYLIEREELDITRVSLAHVTDQYLEYLRALEKLEVDDLTDFIVVAARLLLIKSQSLLPRPPSVVHSEEKDAGEELLRQLRIYRQFKESARYLDERQERGQRCYVRLFSVPYIETGIEHLEAVPFDALLASAYRVMQMRATASPTVNDVVSPITITISDQIDAIAKRLRKHQRVLFSDLLTTTYTRQEVAVTLIAVLELIKQQRIQAKQEHMFGEIAILTIGS